MKHRFNSRLLPVLCLLSVIYGCPGSSEPVPSGDGVQVYGALREIFHQGRTGETVNLSALLPNERLFGVGALTDLAGEITIVRGNAFLSYPEGRQARTTSVASSTEGASLLVIAEVAQWRPVKTNQRITFQELGQAIGQLAQSARVAANRFPFLIEGQVEQLEWHVVDGARLGHGGQSPQDHLEASVRFQRDTAPATLVGFYSKSDQGVFTHAGSATHIHSVIAEPLSSGHVDHVIIPAGTTIMLPAVTPLN